MHLQKDNKDYKPRKRSVLKNSYLKCGMPTNPEYCEKTVLFAMLSALLPQRYWWAMVGAFSRWTW